MPKVKKCDKCFAEVSPGKHKNCNRKERVNNLMNIVSPKSRRQLCLQTIKEEKAKKLTSSPVKLSNINGGPSVPVVTGVSNIEQKK